MKSAILFCLCLGLLSLVLGGGHAALRLSALHRPGTALLAASR